MDKAGVPLIIAPREPAAGFLLKGAEGEAALHETPGAGGDALDKERFEGPTGWNWSRRPAKRRSYSRRGERGSNQRPRRKRPCLTAFRQERARPAGVRGPVERVAFSWLAR